MSDSGVEIIVRKKTGFSFPLIRKSSFTKSNPDPEPKPEPQPNPDEPKPEPQSDPSPAPTGKKSHSRLPTNSLATSKAVKILVITLIMVGLAFGLYNVYPAISGFVLSGFGVDFDYTITASATETFFSEGTETIGFSETSGSKTNTILSDSTIIEVYEETEDGLSMVSSFGASKGDSITLEYSNFDSGGGSLKVFKNGLKVFSDLKLTLLGAQVQYDATIKNEILRSATQEGIGKAGKNGKEGQVVIISATPELVKEGEFGDISYTATTGNPLVTLAVRDGMLYATYVKEAEAESEAAE